MRSKSVQSWARTTDVTWAEFLEWVVGVRRQLGASVTDGLREGLCTGEVAILAGYKSDLVLRQARERARPRIVLEVGKRQRALDERSRYHEVLELHLEGW